MKRVLYFILGIISIACWNSCRRENEVYVDKNTPAPAQVSNLKVTNVPGGAIITYKVPLDSNLSYVKAVYEIQPGIFREAKSSYYTDTLALVGYGDTLAHAVKIYSVGRNEKESAPLPVNISPLTPPVKSVFKTLTLDPTFSGINVSFKNATQADLAIVAMVDTTGQNTWAPVTTYYTKASEGDFSARGFDSTKKKFAVFVRDHWNNRSDTLIQWLKPLYEEMIPKSLFKAVHLPSDSWQNDSHYVLENLWNGILHVREDAFTSASRVEPDWFTIDMGEKVVFSRMKLYQTINWPYNVSWVVKFAIWGSNTPDDGWINWVKLGEFTSVKPSGLPGSQYTAEDMTWEMAGEDYTFPAGVPAVRYFRFVMEESRGGLGTWNLEELTFWGTIVP